MLKNEKKKLIAHSFQMLCGNWESHTFYIRIYLPFLFDTNLFSLLFVKNFIKVQLRIPKKGEVLKNSDITKNKFFFLLKEFPICNHPTNGSKLVNFHFLVFFMLYSARLCCFRQKQIQQIYLSYFMIFFFFFSISIWNSLFN